VQFQISGLKREQFQGLKDLADDALATRGAKRYVADTKPGFPCRVSLRDADPGERVILLSFHHQSAQSPYHGSGPIFVRENAEDSLLDPNQVPDLLRTRLLSLRAYGANDMMVDADVVDGRDVEILLQRFLRNLTVSYIHVHFARPGCFACRVDRVEPV
jgi:uncharacterized protein DUF1203